MSLVQQSGNYIITILHYFKILQWLTTKMTVLMFPRSVCLAFIHKHPKYRVFAVLRIIHKMFDLSMHIEKPLRTLNMCMPVFKKVHRLILKRPWQVHIYAQRRPRLRLSWFSNIMVDRMTLGWPWRVKSRLKVQSTPYHCVLHHSVIYWVPWPRVLDHKQSPKKGCHLPQNYHQRSKLQHIYIAHSMSQDV